MGIKTSDVHVQDDVVMEVINTHANRTLILCKQHVLLVRSTSLALRSMLKSLWAVPISEIKIVRGTLRFFCIAGQFHSTLNTLYSLTRSRRSHRGERIMQARTTSFGSTWTSRPRWTPGASGCGRSRGGRASAAARAT